MQELKSFVEIYSPPKDSGLPEANILLLGQVAAGKSSLFNTVNSVFRGEVSAKARSGTAENSLTTKVGSTTASLRSSVLFWNLDFTVYSIKVVKSYINVWCRIVQWSFFQYLRSIFQYLFHTISKCMKLFWSIIVNYPYHIVSYRITKLLYITKAYYWNFEQKYFRFSSSLKLKE